MTSSHSDNDDVQTNSEENLERNTEKQPEVVCTIEPYVGMIFTTSEEAYEYYNSYAIDQGFGIRKTTSNKSRVSGEVIARKFECDKAGLKVPSSDDLTVARLRDTRTCCKARVNISRNTDLNWIVTVFIKDHNHILDMPRRAKKHRSHKILHKKSVAKNLIDQLYDSGMGPTRIARTLNSTIGSSSVSAKNVSDHLRKLRTNNIGHEGVLIYSYLRNQHDLDPNFYYAIELDIEGVLRSIFWADSRSRNDYVMFGDIVVFDVTYKTNKFMMLFAPFTGVNHHRQSILFGCALLADETEETFIWLFKNWLKCMFNKIPPTIITDMDGVMYNAIKVVFPNTRHRFCSWHIGKHIVEHVYEMRDIESDFKKDYNIWFASKSVTTSDQKWQQLVVKYDIQSTSWLAKMWERRGHWVPAYLKDVFVAGMTSSGRSESMNSFFDGFVNANTQLLEFVNQYDNAFQIRRQAEEHEDFMTMNSLATLFTTTSIELNASQLYTRAMFKLFQHEFKLSLECWFEELNSNSGFLFRISRNYN